MTNLSIPFEDLGKLDSEVRAYNDNAAGLQQEMSAVMEELGQLPTHAMQSNWQQLEQQAVKFRSKLFLCRRRRVDMLQERVELLMEVEKALQNKLADAQKELQKAAAKVARSLTTAGRGVEDRAAYEHNPGAAKHQFDHEVRSSASVRAKAEIVDQLEQDIKACRTSRPQTRNQREHAVAELQQFVKNTLGI